jgi:hypothetical protein
VQVGCASTEQVPTLEVTDTRTKPPERSMSAVVCVAAWFPSLETCET